MTATYEYGPRGEMPPVQADVVSRRRKAGTVARRQDSQMGQRRPFRRGAKDAAGDYGKHVLLPEEQFKDFKRPDPFIPESLGHHKEWIHACKTGAPTTCTFDYSGPLTEANHLGNVAYRAGKKIEWDPVQLKAKNMPQADRYIRRELRKGWTLT